MIKQKISGIYQIKNTINGHIYIGSSNNITVRKYNHLYKLRHNLHHSKYLQRAWNKYDGRNFEFKILLICEPFELLRYEQELLDRLKPEYNISIDALAPTRGRKLSDEHKRKISCANKGHPNYLLHHTEETKRKIGLSSLGKRMTDKQRNAIRLRMLGNKNGYGNKSRKGKSTSDRQKLMASIANSKYFGKFKSPNGTIFDIINLNKFCKENNLDVSCMYRVYTGKQSNHKGWITCQ